MLLSNACPAAEYNISSISCKMCLDEYGLCFPVGDAPPNRTGDLCNKDLALNRGLVCQALLAHASTTSKVLQCLDGNSSCGLMGMLWKKYLKNRNINVEINGLFAHSPDVIAVNLAKNELDVNVLKEDPCVLLRQKPYDFIYLNCKTLASQYLDSLFCRMNNNALVALTTSEDPSLYWQSPGVALRNYGGVIVRTSYFRELGIRLVAGEMARAAARYSRGITILCTASFKAQQSFTIIARVEKGTQAAADSLKNVRRLFHCSVCEDRAFSPQSEFALQSPSSLLSCECSKNADSKTVSELGPMWSGPIFCPTFVQLMYKNCKGFPWEVKLNGLLVQIMEEALCSGKNKESEEPGSKKLKIDADGCGGGSGQGTEKIRVSNTGQPSFYFNTHKHHPSNLQLLKVNSIIQILRNAGYRASRTHFDPGAVRTSATLKEYIQLLERY